ncbi:DnaJ domain-containing protein, partial [Myxococcota bacterium]|nr:DnaJ domain-containing protein [Myxococcota bacterium]
MAAYTFKQLPPGKLLIQLLEKKFTGLLVVRPSGSVISIGFFEGRPVSYEIAGADMNIESLREAMLLLFVDSAHSFEMQSSAVAPEKGHSPLSIIREGVLTHYTKERLIGEARELLKGKLTFVEGYDAYLPLYQFEPNELSVINELSETPSTARELAERTSVPLHRVIGVLYVLALTRLITLYSEAVIIEQPQEDLSDEARALLEELKAALAAMESDNIFERFGVSPSVTTEEVEKKFREKARKFHPDVLQHKGLSAHRALAASYFEKLTEVYNVL